LATTPWTLLGQSRRLSHFLAIQDFPHSNLDFLI
jgi:hypothetical protein